ncbi:hypothetical protein, partial [Litorivivens sp.]
MDVAQLQWLLISQWPGLPRRALLRLLQYAPSPEKILALPDAVCREAGALPEWLRLRSDYLAGYLEAAEARAAAQLSALLALGGQIIVYTDPV